MISTIESSNVLEYNIWCPFCNSKFILELDEVPLPSSEVEKKASEINKSKIPDTKVSHSRSSSSGGFFQSFIKQNDNKMAKSVSQSSIGIVLPVLLVTFYFGLLT